MNTWKSGNLMIKSKLPPQSGSNRETVELHPEKGPESFKVFLRYRSESNFEEMNNNKESQKEKDL